jgi:predicted RNase H-like nuclease (RuvC/YqgF family)
MFLTEDEIRSWKEENDRITEEEKARALEEAKIRDQVKASIIQYLQDFEGYGNAISKIMEECKKSKKEKTNQDAKIAEIREKQEVLMNKIRDEDKLQRELLVNRYQNRDKLEKSIMREQKLRMNVFAFERKKTEYELEKGITDTCTDMPTGVSEETIQRYKEIFARLQHAQKVFPDIEKEVEAETGIHVFTPILPS